MKRVFRFLKAYIRYLIWGKRVDFKTYTKRLKHCDLCETLDREKWVCTGCGCFVDKKAKMNTEKCPYNNWYDE